MYMYLCNIPIIVQITYLSPCDATALQSSKVIVQSWGEWLQSKKHQQGKKKSKGKDLAKNDDDFFYKVEEGPVAA